ncbi:hypothetical protein [Myxosarcina sp. GI1]|uniref:hypothetical protein n=1 Tax=Myxosarcina sp. GI1 TaxID=1541065 RepID=UPI000569F8C6|nr:hypothetical protein [Myxosarcina sp. GI1]
MNNSKFLDNLVIPDAIALELESEDEYFDWSSDGTYLISQDGKKTIPAQKSKQTTFTERERAREVKHKLAKQHKIASQLRFVKFLTFDKNSLGIFLSIVNLLLLVGFWILR